MKTPNHPATIYQDIVTAAPCRVFAATMAATIRANPTNWKSGYRRSASTTIDGCDSEKGRENRQHNEVHILNRLRMVLEPKKCGNRDRERQRSEANYEKHGCRLLAGLTVKSRCGAVVVG